MTTSGYVTKHNVDGADAVLGIKRHAGQSIGGGPNLYSIRPVELDTMGPVDNNPALASRLTNACCEIRFQNGPVPEAGVNGVTGEALLAVVIDRLECFQAGPYPCGDNAEAIEHLEKAMECLHRRTKDRMARNVEGSYQK